MVVMYNNMRNYHFFLEVMKMIFLNAFPFIIFFLKIEIENKNKMYNPSNSFDNITKNN